MASGFFRQGPPAQTSANLAPRPGELHRATLGKTYERHHRRTSSRPSVRIAGPPIGSEIFADPCTGEDGVPVGAACQCHVEKYGDHVIAVGLVTDVDREPAVHGSEDLAGVTASVLTWAMHIVNIHIAHHPMKGSCSCE